MKDSISVIPFAGRKNSQSKDGPKLWAVASGKGGVGKSFVVSSLAVALSKQAMKVTVIDFDLTGANLHSWFGASPFGQGLGEYFDAKNSESPKRLNEFEVSSGVHNVKLIMGFNQTWGRKSFDENQIRDLITDSRKLNSDIVIFDLGAGPSAETLQLLSLVEEKIFLTTPEPQSIESLYRFTECYLVDRLARQISSDKLDHLKYDLKSFRARNPGKPFSFRGFLADHEVVTNWTDLKSEKPVRILINQARSFDDEALGLSIKSVVNKYFDTEIDYLGYLQFDNAVWQCARNKSTVLVEQPFNPLVGQFLSITKQLVDPYILKAVV